MFDVSQSDRIRVLAVKLKMTTEDLANRLKSLTVSLIPVMDIEKDKEFWRTLFCQDENYMKLFANGRKKTESDADAHFSKRMKGMWDSEGLPQRLAFFSLYKGEHSGMICIGPLDGSAELSYITLKEFARNGIATASCKLALDLANHLVNMRKYECHEVWATCRCDNIGSAKVLQNVGLHLAEKDIRLPFGVRDVYRLSRPWLHEDDVFAQRAVQSPQE